ncbi:MAG: P-loop NTPase [Candidatus Micrarchaeia archaeon]
MSTEMNDEGKGEKIDISNPIILQLLEQKKRVKEAMNGVKHKIGIYSAKGGVGKTTLSVNIAYALKLLGFSVGILDADIDCPNVMAFLGINERYSDKYPLKPVDSNGVKVISTGMFIEGNKPVIWRGPLIAKMISEFLQNTEWGDLDYLIVDLPPGTSDAPLSIMQTLDLDGFVLVTTPQHIASINAIRSGMMAKRLSVSLLGVVENMSNGKGDGGLEVASALGCPVIGKIMANNRFNELSDAGKVPTIEDENIKKEFMEIAKKISERK